MRDKQATRDNDVPADVLELLGEDGHKIVTQLINNVHEWFQVSETKLPRNALFWVITQRVVVFLTDVSGQPIESISQVSRFQNQVCCPNKEFL